MKKRITILATLSLLTLAGVGTASAQVTDAIVADIPFDFNVGALSLPAGRYTVKPFGSTPDALMAISDQQGKILRVFLINSAQAKEPPRQAELVFYHFGDRYYLDEVFDQGNPYGAELPMGRGERHLKEEAQASGGGSSYVAVAALNTASKR